MGKNLSLRECLNCHVEFMQEDARQRYCTKLCRGRAKEERMKSDPESAKLRTERRKRASTAAYARDPKGKNASSRDYYSRHKEEQRALALERYYKNRELRMAQSRAWAKANPERHRRNMRRGYLKRVARLREVLVLHITQEQLDARVAYWGDKCWICRSPDWSHLDHVKPISKGGPHILANIRPACAHCNKSKSGRWWGVKRLPELTRAVLGLSEDLSSLTIV